MAITVVRMRIPVSSLAIFPMDRPPAFGAVCIGSPAVAAGSSRPGGDEARKGSLRARLLALRAGDAPEILERRGDIGIFRIKPRRLCDVGQRSIEVAVEEVESGAMVKGFGVFCIKADRLIVVLHGTVEIALGVPDDAAVEVQVDMSRGRTVRMGMGSIRIASVRSAIALSRSRFSRQTSARLL